MLTGVCLWLFTTFGECTVNQPRLHQTRSPDIQSDGAERRANTDISSLQFSRTTTNQVVLLRRPMLCIGSGTTGCDEDDGGILAAARNCSHRHLHGRRRAIQGHTDLSEPFYRKGSNLPLFITMTLLCLLDLPPSMLILIFCIRFLVRHLFLFSSSFACLFSFLAFLSFDFSSAFFFFRRSLSSSASFFSSAFCFARITFLFCPSL